MSVQIKLFEIIANFNDRSQAQKMEDEINTFLLTISDQRILGVEQQYFPMGNIKSPRFVYRTAYVLYENP